MEDNPPRNWGDKDKTAMITGREYTPAENKSLSFQIYEDGSARYELFVPGNQSEEVVEFDPDHLGEIEDIASRLEGNENLQGSSLDFGKPRGSDTVERELVLHQGQKEDPSLRWFEYGPHYTEIDDLQDSFNQLKSLVCEVSQYYHL